MRAVDLEVLKNKLNEYVRLAAGGETILVTERDRVVAELVPPRPRGAEWVDDARLAGLVRDGIVRPPLLPRSAVPPRQPVAPTDEVLCDLLADRDAE